MMMRRLLLSVSALSLAALPALGQTRSIDVNPQGINFSVGRPWTQTLFGQQPISVAPLDLSNSARVMSLLRGGKLYVSLDDAIALALENNLDIAIQRYNLPIADTDILRAKAGSAPRGHRSARNGGGRTWLAGDLSRRRPARLRRLTPPARQV